MEERFIDLETRLAFQEDAIHSLSNTVGLQQRTIDELVAEIRALKTQMRQMASSPVADRSEETPPPHY